MEFIQILILLVFTKCLGVEVILKFGIFKFEIWVGMLKYDYCVDFGNGLSWDVFQIRVICMFVKWVDSEGI